MDLLTSTEGWVLASGRLLWTKNGGTSWQEITPPSEGRTQILGVFFLDANHGWLVRRSVTTDQNTALSMLSTDDGGFTWQENSLPNVNLEEAMQVDSATLDFVDSQTGWVVLKLQSSSNFSFGRLFATQDGGRTWQERSLPLGEPVTFLDPYRGWTAGGPKGDQIFHTEDGGFTWQIPNLPQVDSVSPAQTVFGLPVFEDQESGVLPMTQTDGDIARMYLFSTTDAGRSWALSRTIQLAQISGQDGHASPNIVVEGQILNGELPEGVRDLDLLTNQLGWALVQDGMCTGYKAKAGESIPHGLDPLRCETYSRLLKTTDGGNSWHEITPID